MASVKLIPSPSPMTKLFTGFGNPTQWKTSLDEIKTPTPFTTPTATQVIEPLNTPTTAAIFESCILAKTPTTADLAALDAKNTQAEPESIFDLVPPPTPTSKSMQPPATTPRVVTLPTTSSLSNSYIATSQEERTFADHKIVTRTQIEVVPNKKQKLTTLPSPQTVCKNLKLEYAPVQVKVEAPQSNPTSPKSARKTPKPNKQTLKEKKFVCGFHLKNDNSKKCEMRFYRQDELKRHERTHTGEKPFKCGHCTMTFARSDHVRTHERIHTGERPYPCKYCEKAFARSDERLRHHKVHEKRIKKEKEAKEYQAKRLSMKQAPHQHPQASVQPSSQNFYATPPPPSYHQSVHHPYYASHTYGTQAPAPEQHIVFQQVMIPAEQLHYVETVGTPGGQPIGSGRGNSSDYDYSSC